MRPFKIYSLSNFEICNTTLAGVAEWIERLPVNWKVTGLIPGQGTCPGCRPGPQMGVCKRQPIHVSLTHPCFSPSLSPSLPLSLKTNKNKMLFKMVIDSLYPQRFSCSLKEQEPALNEWYLRRFFSDHGLRHMALVTLKLNFNEMFLIRGTIFDYFTIFSSDTSNLMSHFLFV